MKYNQPYGISDPDGPYINGNPSTGTMGSIPPAASIEYPQREIVNLIADAGLVNPDNADLHQLAKSVQSMLLNAQDDAGTANAYQVTMHPPPTAYFKYLMVICKIGNNNTGPSVLNVNALGAKNIVHIDGTALKADELVRNAIVALMFDGINFQMVWSSGGVQAPIPGMPIWLTAPKDLYVNVATGDDNAHDGTLAVTVAGTVHGPFKTLQRASYEVVRYNLNGFNITVHVADGTNAKVSVYNVAGNGNVIWLGNSATPANCIIDGNDDNAVSGQFAGTAHKWEGFKVQANGTPAANVLMAGFLAASNTSFQLKNIEFGTCKGAHMAAVYTSTIYLDGTLKITGGCPGFVALPGYHMYSSRNGDFEVSQGSAPPTMSIPGAVTFGATYIETTWTALANVFYASITGAGNVTGKKYHAASNSIINSQGGGASYYPGTVAGTIDTQGQYF